MGNEHSHSHNGKPCHGHGNEGHGHSHNPSPQHGHSHNGKPCHGHGGQGGGHGHSHAPQPQHGHSHNGKPCHGHGDHGHSHNHGHGHGHGGHQQQSPEMIKKQRGAQLFIDTMVKPKLPIIFAKFHSNPDRDASKATTSGGMAVPYCKDESMTREEFRNFIIAFLQSQVRADGTNVIRSQQAIMAEAQMLTMLGFGKECKDPDTPVAIPYERFEALLIQLISRITLSAYDNIPFLFAELGLESMKIPKLPLLPEEYELFAARQHCREQIIPHLLQFIHNAHEQNKDETNEAIRSGFVAVLRSIIEGFREQLEVFKKEAEEKGESFDPEQVNGNIVELLTELPLIEKQAIEDPEEVLGLLKLHPHDDHIHPNLIAYNALGPILLPLLMHAPESLVCVLKKWGIEFIVKSDEVSFKSLLPDGGIPVVDGEDKKDE